MGVPFDCGFTAAWVPYKAVQQETVVKQVLDRLRRLIAPASNRPVERALVMTGGGARAAYQAGVLQYIANVVSEPHFRIITGVSAGAINTAHLANHLGPFKEAADGLAESWLETSPERIFESESAFSLIRRIIGSSLDKNPADIVLHVEEGKAILNTEPLRTFLTEKLDPVNGELTGVTKNVESGRLKAACISATNYLTGQTTTWVQGGDIQDWQRPNRVGIDTCLKVEHIMASTALPLLFPAVQVGGAWYGDGGIRLTAPLSPAVHLGADSILAISTRYNRSRREADAPAVHGYPPAAQVMGLLMNAIFLDVLDQDALTMRRINAFARALPPRKRRGFRPIKLLLLRPSRDLGRLASQYEIKVSGALRLLTQGLGTGETASPDWLSMLLFDVDYLSRIMQIGWEDARNRHDDIMRFFDPAVEWMTESVEPPG
jgi:NTE family protein